VASSVLDVCSRLVFGKQAEIRTAFIGAGNIWIKNSYGSEVVALARHIMHEAIQQTAPGQLSIIGLDSDYSGLFAPFASLASGATRQLELLSSTKELEATLEYLGQHIQAVQNVIQGRCNSLAAFRKQLDRPVEGYKLVVLFMNFSTADAKFLAKLSTLMSRGPAAGVSFLIIPANNKISGDRSPQQLDKNISVLSADNGMVALLDVKEQPSTLTNFHPIGPTELISGCEGFLKHLKDATLPVVHFSEVNNLNVSWDQSSENGLTFSVGKYGMTDVEITIGDEINQRHNALITGAVGQGKSNLISVIIHSLCQRYSPQELNLYLLDFKEGVSLKPFVNIGQEEYLPHAKVVGLESDVALGCAVLEFLYNEYLRRLKIFKVRDVKSLKEFRLAFPNEKMPRIVAIIDEFQLMFGDDMDFGQKVVDLLEKSVRLFRAAGIHFILASQSISGNIILSSKKDAIFSQVPIRIAHKNSITESQNTLGLANSAAAHLRAREAIVNVDYGEVSQNRKTVIAWANEKVLQPLRRKWWEAAKVACPPPYVFESEKNIPSSQAAQDAHIHKSAAISRALLGERISITGEKLAIPLPNESGRNIAIIGSPEAERNGAEGIMQGIALSLAAQHDAEEARFLFCDFRGAEETVAVRFPAFAAAMRDYGFEATDIPRFSFQSELNASIDQQQDAFVDVFSNDFFGTGATPAASPLPAAEHPPYTYIFALGLDRWKPTDTSNGRPALKEFLDACAEKGVHFIGWWVKPSNYRAQTAGYEGSDAFNTQVFLRIDEDSVRSLSKNPSVKWKSADNRALLIDEVEYSEEIAFIPYAPM